MEIISIVDYGIGNLLSVQRAFENIGCGVRLISTGAEILQSEHLVLPGVGAFEDGMLELKRRNLSEPIKEYCNLDRPFLGICLGMQLMFESSEESKHEQGLGIINGIVIRLNTCFKEGIKYKVPNIGWYCIRINEGTVQFLDGIKGTDRFYFVHSYGAHPTYDASSLASLEYGNNSFSAVVRRGNCYGTQFHPEKSGEAGMKILCNFVRI